MSKRRRRRRNSHITRLYREQKGHCYLCGRQMTMRLGQRGTATIEHLVSAPENGIGRGGETKAACHECNNLKGELPLEVTIEIFRSVEKEGRTRQVWSTEVKAKIAQYRIEARNERLRCSASTPQSDSSSSDLSPPVCSRELSENSKEEEP